MSYDNSAVNISVTAATDLSLYQFYAVKIDSSGDVALCSTAAEKALGILQNKPAAAARGATVAVSGVSKAIAGAAITYWDPVGPNASGKLIKMDEEDEAVLGRALESAAAADVIIPILITHEGSAAAYSDTTSLVSSANYTVTGQYLAVKAHTTAGEFVRIAAAKDSILGVLQNAPNTGEAGSIKTSGVTTVTAGTGNLAAGDRMAVDASGQFVTATTGPACGFALAAITDGATGSAFLMPQWLLDATGSALASAKIYVGTAGGLAAAVDMSGEATISNTGVITIAADSVGVAEMSSTVAGTDGCIFKSTSTPDAVTELDVPVGNIIVGTTNDVGLLDMGNAAGNIMVDSGTAPASVAMGGEATLAADGTLTIAADAVGVAEMSSTVAGSDGCIFKSTSTPDAVTELDVLTGNLIVGTAGDVSLLDMGAAAGNIMVDSGTAPVSVAVGGDATLAANGALTIAADAIDATKMSSVVAGTDGCIFKSTSTPDAVTELDVPVGNIVVGTTNDVGLLDMGNAAGNLMIDSGTAPASVAMSGDATIAAGGAITLAKPFIRQATTNWDAAAVIASNVTALVLVDFSVLQTAGTVAAGDCLIFHHCVCNLYGGAANYDNNQNVVINYGPNGAGATVSLTLANFLDGNPAGSITDIKQLATVVVPDADEDLDLIASASPFAAAGDRLLRVTCYYSVYTPAA